MTLLSCLDKIKQQTLQGATFEQIDQTGDELLSVEDFKILLQARLDQVVYAFELGDDNWIWSNYFRISTEWYRVHVDLA